MDLQTLNTEQRRQALADMARGGDGEVFNTIYETEHNGRHVFAIDTPGNMPGDVIRNIFNTAEQAQRFLNMDKIDI